MTAKRIFGLLDVIEISDVGEIKAANELAQIDRRLCVTRPLLNGLLLNKLLAILSYRGKRFPTMLPRLDASRAHDQNTLWNRLETEGRGCSRSAGRTGKPRGVAQGHRRKQECWNSSSGTGRTAFRTGLQSKRGKLGRGSHYGGRNSNKQPAEAP